MKPLLLIFTSALLLCAQPLPPSTTPGALNPSVTQSNIHQTICDSGWTATVRPPASFTDKLKAQQMQALGLKGDPHLWEEDHRVPLSSGGAPQDPRNLWPQKWEGSQGAHAKDAIEDQVHRAICSGRITLKQGREIFLGDWWTLSKKYGLDK